MSPRVECFVLGWSRRYVAVAGTVSGSLATSLRRSEPLPAQRVSERVAIIHMRSRVSGWVQPNARVHSPSCLAESRSLPSARLTREMSSSAVSSAASGVHARHQTTATRVSLTPAP